MPGRCLLCLVLLMWGACAAASEAPAMPEAAKGVLDLSDYEIVKPVKLSGEWYFSWESFQSRFDTLQSPAFVHVPEGRKSSFSRSPLLNRVGYFTYGLKIILPRSGNSWMLHIPPVHSAFNLYVDGKLHASAGKIAKDRRMFPEAKPQTAGFETTSDTVFITLEVSNFYFSQGGMWTPLSLGTPEVIKAERDRNILISSFFIGGLVIMGFYHIALYFLRRKNVSALYFSVICLFIALRELFAREAIFYMIWPTVNYEIAIKLLYSVFPVCFIALVLYFESLFPVYIQWMKRVSIIAGSLFLVLILLTDNMVYGQFLSVIILVFVVQCIYWFVLMFADFRADVRQHLLIFTGLICVIAAIINDILYEKGIVDTFFALSLGFFMFVLCQALLLSIRFARAVRQTEVLSIELRESALAYREVSLKQQRAEEMKAIEEMKNHFFSNITHEFKTPLSLIISPIEKLRRGAADKEVLDRSLAIIYRNAESLLNLVNQLLDLSRLDARRMQVSCSRGNPVDFLTNLVSSFGLAASEKDISIDYSFEYLPDDLVFDSEKLERIVSNLLSNALKFTLPGGSVSVTASFEKEELILRVSDSGIGIPPEKQPYIFNRFYQGDTSSTRLFGGTGIGLTLVKELVELVGGKIYFESKTQVGTTFCLVYPAVTPSEESSGLTQPPLQRMTVADTDSLYEKELPFQEDRGSFLVLLVEDNKELLEYIGGELADLYRVITARNGKEAWELCENELPDLIISDVMMPEMDGLDLCKKVKETEATNHIGVILLTAKGSFESRVLGLETGANDYLPKPFSMQELVLRINNFLRYKQNLKEFFTAQLSGMTTPGPEESPERNNLFLLKLYEKIDQSIDDSTLSVNDIASALAVSSRTLNRKLTSLIGMSTNEVIKKYRLKKSIGLLRSGYTVSEVAYRVGFDSPSYFGHCFKEEYSKTPSEFIAG